MPAKKKVAKKPVKKAVKKIAVKAPSRAAPKGYYPNPSLTNVFLIRAENKNGLGYLSGVRPKPVFDTEESKALVMSKEIGEILAKELRKAFRASKIALVRVKKK